MVGDGRADIFNSNVKFCFELHKQAKHLTLGLDFDGQRKYFVNLSFFVTVPNSMVTIVIKSTTFILKEISLTDVPLYAYIQLHVLIRERFKVLNDYSRFGIAFKKIENFLWPFTLSLGIIKRPKAGIEVLLSPIVF